MGSSLMLESLILWFPTARGSIAGYAEAGAFIFVPRSSVHTALIHAYKLPHWGHSRAPLHRHRAHVGWREMLDREFDPAPQPLPAGRAPPTAFIPRQQSAFSDWSERPR